MPMLCFFSKRFSFDTGIKTLLFLFLVSAYPSQGQPSWAWAQDIHTVDHEKVLDVAIDQSSGNVVLAGVYNSSLASFYGSSFTGSVKGGFVAKYDSNGNIIWGFSIGNNQDIYCNGIVADDSGNIYVTGSFELTVDFKGLSSTPAILTASGPSDIFIAKYNSSGQLLWVNKAGGSNADAGNDIAIFNNKVYITGYYSGSASFGALSSFANSSSENVFVTTYTSGGTAEWLADAGSSSFSHANDVAADSSGIYIIGEFEGSALQIYNSTGIPAASISNASATESEAVVIHYGPLGDLLWTSKVSSNQDELGNSITLGPENVFICGAYEDAANFTGFTSNPVLHPGSARKMFVAALDKNSGTTEWVKTESSTDVNVALAITSDLYGYIYVGGHYKNSLSFAGGPSFSAGGGDGEQIFVAAYSWAGAFQWARETGENNFDAPHSLAAINVNEVYVGGEYDKDPSFGSTVLYDDGGTNAFIAKLACPLVLNNNISASQTICQGTTPSSLTGTLPSGGTGILSILWEKSNDSISWTPATGVNFLQNYSPPSLSSTTYYRRKVSSSSLCFTVSYSNAIAITVDSLPDPSTAGSDQTICISSNAIMNANLPSSGTGTWSIVTGSGTISDLNSPVAAITALSAGDNVFEWTISNGACPSSSSTVTVHVDPLPDAADAGPDQVICLSGGAVQLSATSPSVGSGLWTLYSGSLSDPFSPTTSVSLPSQGTFLFEWTVSNGACPASNDSMYLTAYDLPDQAAAGPDQTICESLSALTLNANIPAAGNGAWAVVSGSAVIVDPTSALSLVNLPGAGSSILTWSISNGTCPSSTDTVHINVDQLPTIANAGADQSVCIVNPGITLNANSPSAGTGSWSVFSGIGIFADPSSALTLVNISLPGLHRYVWTISSGVCPSSSDTVDVSVSLLPSSAVACPDINECVNTAIDLTASAPAVGSGLWTSVSGNATIVSPAATQTSVANTTPGQHVFVWTVSNGACPASSDTVYAFLDALPDVADAGQFQVFCENQQGITLNANIPTVGIGSWTLLSGNAIIDQPGSSQTSITAQSGTNIFQWTVSNGLCPSSMDTVSIVLIQEPSAAIAGEDQNVNVPLAQLAAVAPTSGTGSWTVIMGAGIFENSQDPSTTVFGLSVGSNVFRWTVDNSVCNERYDDVLVYMQELAIPNAFSPNDDGINDQFVVPGLEYYMNISFTVFNKWGNIVYSSNDYRNDWKGQNNSGEMLTDDTYYFLLDIKEGMKYNGFIIIKSK
jgi:gliding motility-associated-like protein